MPDAGPHLVRVAYANVNYNRMAPPGVSTVDMKVFESTKKVDALDVKVETAYQSDGE